MTESGQRHIHIRLPNASMRRELFAHHLPNPDRVTADYAVLVELSKGLSGGDILNVCVNAIYAGSVDSDSAKWAVTQEMIEAEFAKARNAKEEHSGGEGRAEAEDWVSAGVIKGKMAFEGLGRSVPGWRAGTGCEGVCHAIITAFPERIVGTYPQTCIAEST